MTKLLNTSKNMDYSIRIGNTWVDLPKGKPSQRVLASKELCSAIALYAGNIQFISDSEQERNNLLAIGCKEYKPAPSHSTSPTPSTLTVEPVVEEQTEPDTETEENEVEE